MLSAEAEWKVLFSECGCCGFGEVKRRLAYLIRHTVLRFGCVQPVILRKRSVFSTVYLLNAAKSDGVSDRLLVQCGESGD